jgi:hypothetical protein
MFFVADFLNWSVASLECLEGFSFEKGSEKGGGLGWQSLCWFVITHCHSRSYGLFTGSCSIGAKFHNQYG